MTTTNNSPDPILPVLTADQAVRFHEQVRAAFTRRGLDAVYRGDDSYQVGDSIFGLANLSVVVSEANESDWDRLIERHFGALLAHATQDAAPSTAERIYLRPRHIGTGESGDYPRHDIVDGMEVVFAVDYPNHVSEIGKASDLAHLGDVDNLWSVGMANLRRLPAPEHDVIPLVDEDAGFPLHVFFCEDYFGASRILFVDEVVDEVLGDGFSSEHGLLVAIPQRHLMLVYVVEDSRTMVGCTRLASIAQDQFDTSPGAVTPRVFYRATDGSLTQVAHLTDDGRAYIKPTDEMAALMFDTDA